MPLHAHDIYSSWCEAKILPDRMEVTLTLARSAAQGLLPDSNKLPAITPETFAELAPRLRQIAPELLQISAAGKPLGLRTGEVKLGDDTDVTFRLTYPRPPPGKLRLFACYLGQLVDGHVGTLVVTNSTGDDLGWSPVTVDQPVFETTLPGEPPRKRPPAK